jgi:lipopolysaccharide/colanic/teichoic acid biosynthesis glycosyltransferase
MELVRSSLDSALKRSFDAIGAGFLLVVFAPFILVIAVAIKADSPGPVLYRCRRVGSRGREFWMLKFRKMHDRARGPALTVSEDTRLTPVGRFLARSKIDEIPQLWNVLRGQMSFVGPRPEDPGFVELRRADFDVILQAKPGITGLSQLAFARESELLDPADRLGDYLQRFLPQKIALDRKYVARRTIWSDLRILAWTVAAIPLRQEVAVNRQTIKLTVRRRQAASQLAPHPAALTLREHPGPLGDAFLHPASTSSEEPTQSWN